MAPRTLGGLCCSALLLGACHGGSSPSASDASLPADAAVYNGTELDFDLGHVAPITGVWRVGNAGLSLDQTSRWVLWDIAAQRAVASGQLPCGTVGMPPCPPFAAGLVGGTLAVRAAAGIELRSPSTGSVLATVNTTAQNAGLAIDGSYLWAGSPLGLQAWSTTGDPLFDLAGDYTNAAVFAEASVLRVASGPAGPNAIEVIQTSDQSKTTLSFTGAFQSWFDDGQHFLSAVGTTVSVYSNTGARLAIGALPTVQHLTGQGAYVWTYEDHVPGYPLRIYAAANLAAPVQTYNLEVETVVTPAGPGIAILPALQIISLGSSVTRGPYIPISIMEGETTAFSPDPAGDWIVGTYDGVVLDSETVLGPPGGRVALSSGLPLGLTGTSGHLGAISTASGRMRIVDLSTASASTQELPIHAGQIDLSEDGSTLIADVGSYNAASGYFDSALSVFSLPSGSLSYAWQYPGSGTVTLDGFSFARQGLILSHILVGTDVGTEVPYRLTDLVGNELTGYGPDVRPHPVPQLSPDGVHGAFIIAGTGTGGSRGPVNATTQLYSNGVLTGAVSGNWLAWLDNDRVLTAAFHTEWTHLGQSIVFDGAAIYDSAGNQLAATKLPDPSSPTYVGAIGRVTAISGGLAYLQASNAVYDYTTGDLVWQGDPAAADGVVVGDEILYTLGYRVFRAKFR